MSSDLALLDAPERVLILGNAGAGKSTLAQKLGVLYNLPVLHLDTFFFGPHWQHPDPQEWQRTLQALVNQDTWVMEGQRNNLDMRLARAQMVIYLDVHTPVCLWRVIKRRFTAASTVFGRPPHCPERLSWTFLRYVLTFNRKRAFMLETIERSRVGRRVYLLKGARAVTDFEQNLPTPKDQRTTACPLEFS